MRVESIGRKRGGREGIKPAKSFSKEEFKLF